MKVKDKLIKAAVIIAAMLLIWFLLTKFMDIADDNFGSANDQRTSYEDRVNE